MSIAVDYDPFIGSDLVSTTASTEAQREIWASAQLGDDASCAFNESITLRMKGLFDLEVCQRAFHAVIARHDALRSTFSPDGSLVCITASANISCHGGDLSALLPNERERKLCDIAKEEVGTPFDLEHGPLLRCRLIKLDREDHAVIITAHHIVCDGWSMSILVRDLAALYSAEKFGRAPSLPEVLSFEEYSHQMSVWAESDQGKEDERYWLERYRGPIPVLELPTDRPRPPVKTFASERHDHTLDAELVANLRKTGVKAGASFFVTLLAAFQVFLHRITGQEDLVVGVPAAGQSALGMENLVGHCVNLLPIRSTIRSDISMTDLLKAVRSAALDAFDHQRYTFGTLIRNLKIERDPSRIPLVSVLFNLDQPTPDDQLGFEELKVECQSNPRSYENFELFINASESKAGVVLECQFNTDLFDRATIESYLESFEALLRGIADDSTQLVGKLPLLSHAQQQRVLVDWNATYQDFGPVISVVELFEQQVAKTPGRIAVQMDDKSLTYAELDARANQIAHHLQSVGVTSDGLVGLCIERSLEMVIGLLGILKTGAGYVPLDPEYPVERLRYMIDDAELTCLLTTEGSLDSLPDYSGVTVCIDRDYQEIGAAPRAPLNSEISARDIAYVIYTSGSTGKPKGVQVPHGTVVNFLCAMQQTPGITAEDVLVAVTTLCFDISVLEILLPLVTGAKVVIADAETASDGDELLELLKDCECTFLQATPSTWRLLLGAGWEGLPKLKALCGGEALPVDLVPKLLVRTTSLWNMYGPTETTVWSTYSQITDPDAPITIGQPIANTQVYIFDANKESVPPGVPGELYIGGAGVTLGYRHRPELTNERFVSNPYYDPFADYVNGALYRTGDIARFRKDGNVEYLRRNDRQVKLRGYRIELGEIEAVLALQPGIKESAVTIWQGDAVGARLSAYYVPCQGDAITATDLRKGLRKQLPDYMIPQHFVELTALPRTNNNKIDRKALPTPIGLPCELTREMILPRTERELLVASVWLRLLGVSRVSVHDNFFQLGGHSLTAMQAIVEIKQQTGVRLSPRSLLLSTLEQIAEQLIDR